MSLKFMGGGPLGGPLEVTGAVPPSRHGMRLGTQSSLLSSSRAGARSHHGLGEPQREALTAFLIGRMRERFKVLQHDSKAQEVIGQEVTNHIRVVGDRASEADAVIIEERIRNRLLSSSHSMRSEDLDLLLLEETPGYALAQMQTRNSPHAVQDEWATIMKYEAAMDQRKQHEAKSKLTEQRRKMRVDLDEQVAEQTIRRKMEEHHEAELAVAENHALAQWKAQEKRRMEERRRMQQLLKEDRDRQLKDHAELRMKSDEERRQEDICLRRQAVLDTKRSRLLEERMKRANMQFMDKLKLANEETKRIRQDLREREAQEEIEYAQKFADTIEKQDKERRAAFERLQEEQNRRMKSLMDKMDHAQQRGAWDDDLIEKHRLICEQRILEEQRQKQQKDDENKQEMRRILALQLKDREERNKRQHEAERALIEARKARLQAEIAEEAAIKQAAIAQRLAHRRQLEEQIRENARRKEPVMDKVERSLNSSILEKVKETLGVVV